MYLSRSTLVLYCAKAVSGKFIKLDVLVVTYPKMKLRKVGLSKTIIAVFSCQKSHE